MIKRIFALILLLFPSLAFAGPTTTPTYNGVTLKPVKYAQLLTLPSQLNGTIVWCPDCTQTTTCAGTGPGAFALRIGSVWNCASGSGASSVTGLTNPLIADVDAAAHTLTNANISKSSINNVINVMAPPYNAKGDGSTDDLPGIQKAIYDACGVTNPPVGNVLATAVKSVYLPPPGVCFMHSAPLRIPCKGLELYGQGSSSALCQNYHGHAVIQEAWGVANLATAASLVTGSGNSLISAADTPPVIDIGRRINGSSFSGLSTFAQRCVASGGCNIALFVKHTVSGGIILQSSPSYPGSGNGAFNFTYGAGDAATISVNTTGGLITLASCPAQSLNTTYELELDWDGTTYRGWQGVPGGTASLCGSSASANPPVQKPYEVVMLPPHGRTGTWPVAGSGGIDGSMVGNLDSIRFEKGSVHTAAYTVPTTKWSGADSNIFYMTNFETPLDGTVLGYTGEGGNGKAYSTVAFNGSGTIGYAAQGNIHDLELCSNANGAVGNYAGIDGLWAVGANDSIWRNLNCSNTWYGAYDFASNDYLSRVENLHSFGGHYGILEGGAYNGTINLNNGVDQTDYACEVHEGGGGGAYENYHAKCVNRGTLYYGWVEDNSSANFFYPDMDMEAGATNFVSDFLLQNPQGYYFYGAGLSAPNGVAFVTQDGGGFGSSFIGAHFAATSGTPSYLVNYINGAPTTPTQFINTMGPLGTALSNLWQWAVSPGQDVVAPTLTLNGGTTNVPAPGAGNWTQPLLLGGPGPDTIQLQKSNVANQSAQFTVCQGTRSPQTVADGVENSTTTVTSATAAFVPADVGRAISGANIPASTTIATYTNATTVVLSQAATATTSGVTFTFGGYALACTTAAGLTKHGSCPTIPTTASACKLFGVNWQAANDAYFQGFSPDE